MTPPLQVVIQLTSSMWAQLFNDAVAFSLSPFPFLSRLSPVFCFGVYPCSDVGCFLWHIPHVLLAGASSCIMGWRYALVAAIKQFLSCKKFASVIWIFLHEFFTLIKIIFIALPHFSCRSLWWLDTLVASVEYLLLWPLFLKPFFSGKRSDHWPKSFHQRMIWSFSDMALYWIYIIIIIIMHPYLSGAAHTNSVPNI